MVGPILSLELLLGKRRTRLDTLRRLFAAWLVVQLIALLLLYALTRHSLQALAINDFVERYYDFFVVEHFLLLVLIVPAMVAGAITDEKAQGTLQHLLVADATSWEIIVGKLLGRLIQVGLVSLTGWPLLCLVAGSGYRPWTPIVCLAVVTALFLLLLGSASIWASVRSRQTRDAVLRVYFWFGLAALIVWAVSNWPYWMALAMYRPSQLESQRLARITDFLNCLDPLYVLDPTWGDNNLREFGRRLQTMLLVYGGLSSVWLLLATWRLRPSTIRYMEGRRRKRRRLAWRREVGEDPVLWRERGSRGIWSWLGVAVIAAATYTSSRWIIEEEQPAYWLVQGGVIGLLLSFLAGVRASGTISGERERQTWESLLLTPMETWEIVEDKANGVLQALDPLFAAFLVPAMVLSFYDPVSKVSAIGFTVSILLIDWATMTYMAAAGVNASARSLSSWRSLIATLAGGYAYCFAILVGLAFAYVWLGCILMPLVGFFLTVLGYSDIVLATTMSVCGTAALCLVLILWRRAVKNTGDAEVLVDSQERYGRTFVRSLTMALRKHYNRLAEKQRQRGQPVDASVNLFGPQA